MLKNKNSRTELYTKQQQQLKKTHFVQQKKKNKHKKHENIIKQYIN